MTSPPRAHPSPGSRQDAAPRDRALGAAVALALVVTVALGALLRASLAGYDVLPPLPFKHLRHAHTHLGWYGAVLPLAMAVWRRASGLPGAGRPLAAVYVAAVAVAIAGFAWRGYGVAAIAGSTVILAAWIVAAWRLHRSGAATGWLAPTLPAVLLGAACIPPVAALLRRDPPLAQAMVAAFLTMLGLGVALPAVLQRLGAPPPPRGVWLLATVVTALALGPLPDGPARVGPLALGMLVVGTAWRAAGALRVDLRVLLALVGAGLVAVGAGAVRLDHALAVAAVHLLVLGPLLHGLIFAPTGAQLGRAATWLHHALLVGMGAAIALPPAVLGAPTAPWAAGTGAALALWWAVALVAERTWLRQG